MCLLHNVEVDKRSVNLVMALHHVAHSFVFHTYRSQLVVRASLVAAGRFMYDHLAHSVDKLTLRSGELTKYRHCRQPLPHYELL